MSIAALYSVLRKNVLTRVPLGMWRRLVPRDVLSLIYHTISDRVLPHAQPIGRYKEDLQFEADLRFLASETNVVDCDKLTRGRLQGRPLPPAAFQITFDDGFRECYEVIRPLLIKHALPATFFIPTDFIDNRDLIWVHKIAVCVDRAVRIDTDEIAAAIAGVNGRFGQQLDRRAALVTWLKSLKQSQRVEIEAACELLGVDVPAYLRYYRPYLSVDQIEQLAADGFTIGAHTRKHEILGEYTDPVEIEREIVESCRIVCDITGAKQVPFAFPVHGRGVDRDLLADIRARHDCVGLIFDTGKLGLDRDFIVHRLACDSTARGLPGQSNLPYLLRRDYMRHGERANNLRVASAPRGRRG